MTHSPSSQANSDPMHQAMAARVERAELPGLLTLVARGNDVRVDTIGVKTFGGGDLIRRDTPFRIASMTKPILAAATKLLVEDGKLDLHESVDRLLPELANRAVLARIDGPLNQTVPATRPITVEDLLTSRMGFGMLVEPTFDPPFPIVDAARELQLVLGEPDPRTPHAPDEWIRRFGTLPLMYQPGERWQYNVSALVLGVLVARAAGQSLPEFFERRIFKPLGMQRTGFWLPAELAADLPSCYMTDFETGHMKLRNLSTPREWSSPPVFPSGAGGLLSTADDFLAFARMLLNRGIHGGTRLLSESSVELMTTNHLTPAQIAGGGVLLGGSGWGYGMAVVTQPDEVFPVPGRYGWSGGYGTDWFNDPARGVVAILLTQTVDVMWNGTLPEFQKLVEASAFLSVDQASK